MKNQQELIQGPNLVHEIHIAMPKLEDRERVVWFFL